MSGTIERPASEDAGTPESHQEAQTPGGAPPKRSRARWAVVAILVVLALALYVGLKPRLARRTALAGDVALNTGVPVVSVAKIEVAPGPATVVLPGSIAAFATTPIYGRAPGYIGKLFVDIGSHVRRGELLALIDAPELDHQVQQARAMVVQAEANLDLARVELARWLQMMRADSAVTQEEVDIKRAAFGVASATLTASVATWRQLRQLQSYERVLAPFDGVVTARNVNVGALVGTTGAVGGTLLSAQSSATGSLFEVARIDTLRVYITVPEDNAAGVRSGMAALVTVPSLPGDTLRGRVARTSRALDPAARTLLTEVDVANPARTYLPGSYAEVRLSLTQSASTLKLPATALVITDGPPQVITVGADSTVRFHTVTLGRDYGSWVEVTNGLERNATVVLNPPDLLRSGQRVRVTRTTPSTASQ